MKLFALVTAGLVTAVALAPASVAAAPHGHGWRTKTVCKVVWKGHHKVRQCRQVRVRG